MKTLFSLLLAVVSQLTTPGHLFVHMTPGFEVIVDGTSVGMTANDVGGKIVDQVDVNPVIVSGNSAIAADALIVCR